MITNSTTRLRALISIVALSGCAGINSGADFPAGLRLDRYQTFAWGGGDTLPVGDPRLENNPFFDARVRSAVEHELTAKGLRRATVSPDLLVHYHASVRQRVDVVRTDEARGYSSPELRATDKVVEFDEGTLIVDVVDPRNKAVIWRGWSQTDVSGLIEQPKAMEKRINASVRLMMQRFPRTP